MNRRIATGAMIIISILFVLTISISGSFFYIDLVIAFLFSILIYVPSSINIINKISGVIKMIETDGNCVKMESNNLESFLGIFNISSEKIEVKIVANDTFKFESNFNIINYKTEVYSFIFNKKKFYIVEGFFDDFEAIKKSLNIL